MSRQYGNKDKKGKNKYGKDNSKRRNANYSTREASDKQAERMHNDVSWYTRYRDLVDSAAKVPFPYTPGRLLPAVQSQIQIWTGDNYVNVPAKTEVRIPSLMVLRWHLVPGYSDNISSPVNIAAREIYARIRSKYSGSLEADAPDIMMYILAVDSIYACIEDMKRAYYLSCAYTPYNTDYPDETLLSLGWDPESVKKDKMYLLNAIQVATANVNKFKVPADLDIIKRHQFMNANIYADAPNRKAQHYAFVMETCYKLRYDTETGTALEPFVWHENGGDYKTPTSMVAKLTELIDALSSWDTGYTILGYLLRGFEDSAFLTPAPVVPDAILEPVYDEGILLQIHNASIGGVVNDSLRVTQDPTTNTIFCTPYRNVSEHSWQREVDSLPKFRYFDMPGDQTPDTDAVVYATRLMHHMDLSEDGTRLMVKCGTELVSMIEIWNGFSRSNSGNVIILDNCLDTGFNTYDLTRSNNAVLAYRYLAWSQAFDYRPITYGMIDEIVANAVTGEYKSRDRYGYGIFSNYNNITKIDNDVLSNLTRMCIYSLFNCFGIV